MLKGPAFSMSVAVSSVAVSIRLLVLALMAVMGGMQLLLWAYLGLGPVWIFGGAMLLGMVMLLLARAPGWRGDVPLAALGAGCAVAALVLMLGGEGGWFFATPDWQVRYAVLRDLTLHPWPFVLDHPSGVLVLRAPVGMYLAPAMIGALAGGFRVACLALLLQNTLVLGVVLALGAGLFATARGRWIGLGVFWAFSGMDILGQAIVGGPLALHLEGWAGMQFSSMVTLAFWAPQHGLAGWFLAVLYLLWREERVPGGVMLAAMPLVALLSPLAMIGGVPFAAHVGHDALRRPRGLGISAAAVLFAAMLALPALVYLQADRGAVGGGAAHGYHLSGYLLFILLELGGYLLALRAQGADQPFGLATTLIAVGCLLAAPFAQVGEGADFVMRASIPALAVMAVMMGRLLADHAITPARMAARRWILIMGAVGIATPAGEVWRALTWPVAPEVTCGYLGVIPAGYATYTMRATRLPVAIRAAHPALVPMARPRRCWARGWPDPISGQATQTHPY